MSWILPGARNGRRSLACTSHNSRTHDSARSRPRRPMTRRGAVRRLPLARKINTLEYSHAGKDSFVLCVV